MWIFKKTNQVCLYLLFMLTDDERMITALAYNKMQKEGVGKLHNDVWRFTHMDDEGNKAQWEKTTPWLPDNLGRDKLLKVPCFILASHTHPFTFPIKPGHN